ncbi:hypothetical protein [Halapricum desulfuricans]|uniref:Uncharacterized protein n=1 Tax=Halapricum desulfuricans TaxID=2841257 RepID=A0A897N5F1_9EURY|nr:hypothetical protein [Halapricum desulfuricans]QSG06463.1 Uncharacterized protein HSR121_2132 [Halapricum desulfuricans]
MAKPSASVTLYGDRAEQFRSIKDDLEDVLGHEPPNAQVVGLMMADFDPDAPLSADPAGSR